MKQYIQLANWGTQGPFSNSYGNQGLSWGVVHTINMQNIAPVNAVGVGLSGTLIITHGTTQETANLRVSFRPSSTDTWYGYRGQTIEAHVGGGQRSNHSIVVPMKNRTFQMLLEGAEGKPQWPTYSAYGINYIVDYWVVEDE